MQFRVSDIQTQVSKIAMHNCDSNNGTLLQVSDNKNDTLQQGVIVNNNDTLLNI